MDNFFPQTGSFQIFALNYHLNQPHENISFHVSGLMRYKLDTFAQK